MSEHIKLSGTIEGVIFHNSDNGYTVFVLSHEKLPGSNETMTTCVGHVTEPTEGMGLIVEGEFVENPRYGTQLKALVISPRLPSSTDGIRKYLASGAIKGIGTRTADAIVSEFGADAFEVLENEPERIAALKGIGLKRAMRFSESLQGRRREREVMLFMQAHGISPRVASRIYKRYKEETINVLRSNPYQLADDIDGIGFKSADVIARQLGLGFDMPERISSGIKHVLWTATNEGHTCLPIRMLIEQSAELLGCRHEQIENEIIRLNMERVLIRERLPNDDVEMCFSSKLYYAEISVAKKLAALAAVKAEAPSANPEAAQGLELSEGQKQAARLAQTEGVLIITGGPGTGKTTIINTIIDSLEAAGLDVVLAAPTGRAAKRMTEATGREAKTIHRLLEVTYIALTQGRTLFNRDEDNPIEADVVIIDESSMMDISLAQSLLRAIEPGTRLILVGDMDQLPSVGPGNVLKDLILSECLPVVHLTEIFRQAQKSAIVMNAHRINHGNAPVLNERDNDFFFIERSGQAVTNTILELVSNRLPKNKGFDILADIQVLTPMRISPVGCVQLNTLLQAAINPPSYDKPEREHGKTTFRQGDKVMQTKNNYTLEWIIYDDQAQTGEGIFNGDIGIISEVTESGLVVCFDDIRFAEYEQANLDELELAYATTVHKSQGSEYRAVVIPITPGPPMLLTRNLLYTAITRARELVILVGSRDTLQAMINNDRAKNRNTALLRRMKNLPRYITSEHEDSE